MDAEQDNLENLIKQMTLEEKIGQMVQADVHWSQDIKQLIKQGRIGSMLSLQDTKLINGLQKIAVEESRLGIPLIFGNDVIHGYKTILPIPLAQACSWNMDLIFEADSVAAGEALASGTQWNFAPMVDVCRDPRWGRIAEGGGEDPYLNARIAEQRVKAYQRTHPGNRRMAACVKHFAGYGAPIAGKDYNSVDMSKRQLYETYFPPFKQAIQAGAASLMTAFHDLNGIPATANKFLLCQVLRQEWEFDGVVISDYDAIGELIQHRVAKDHREASLLAARAGVEVDMTGNAYHFHLSSLVTKGLVDESWINKAVYRILALKQYLNIFEKPYVEEKDEKEIFLTPKNLDTTRKMAEESIVLLKNDGCLPIETPGKNIAVIGPLADDPGAILGCWKCAGDPHKTETVLHAIKKKYSESKIRYCPGCTIDGSSIDREGISRALDGADVCLLFTGESAEMSGEAHNRAYLGLPGVQNSLVELVAEYRIPTVLVVMSGRPLVLTGLVSRVDAVVLALHGGSKAGEALANIIDGTVNPSGKLPVSLPRAEGQIPLYYAYNSTGRPIETKGVIQFNKEHKTKYLDLDHTPLYEFGYGLSYTTFTYSNYQCNKTEIKPGEEIRFSISVTNTGRRAGKETVQVYLQDCVASIARPVKQLYRFHQLFLQPDETTEILFTIDSEELGFFNEEGKVVLEPGEFSIFIGPSSNAPLCGSFILE